MLYFAYGSNLCTGRLQARTPSASKVAVGVLPVYSLRFHKIGSTDGSAKCNIRAQPDASVYGVVFDIDEREKPDLNRAEGVGAGYEVRRVEVQTDTGLLEAFTYRAEAPYIDDSLQPFRWYKRLVLAGAREHGLPEAYIAGIQSIADVDDPDRDRRKRELSVLG